MATFVPFECIDSFGETFRKDPVSLPAGYFHDDPRFRRTDEFCQDYVGALNAKKLREFRDLHSLHGRDWEVDQLLDSV